MSLVVATERAIAQRMCGYPDQQEISDAQIDAIFTVEALRWINDRRPAIGLSYFTTVANQQDYNVKPVNAYDITDVWWQQQGADVFSPILTYLPDSSSQINAFAGFNVLDNPAIVTEFYKKLSEYDFTFRGSGWETPEGKIRLEPVPAGNGDVVYFEYSYPRWSAITSVPDQFREGVRYYVASCMLQVLTIRRGAILSGKNFTGGGGNREKEFYEIMLQKAEALVPYLTTPLYRG